MNWKLTAFDIARGLFLGVLLCQVFLKLFGADTSLLDIRYAGY